MMPAEDTGAPKYIRIAAELRQQIITGVLRLGDRLPSEPELTDRYGVSKTTAARALDILTREGVIERRVGSGSYVVKLPDAVTVISAGPGTRISVRAAEGLLIVERPGAAAERYRADTTVIIVPEHYPPG